MNVNNDDLMHMVLESFYTNNFNFNLNNISSYTEDNVNIYNILSLYDQNYIEDLLNIFNFKYNKTNPVISNYFNYLNITNNYWKENIISLYDQYYEDENNLSTKVNDIFDNNKICEHGIIINFIDNFIPYWLWENIFRHMIDNLDIKVEKQLVQTLYHIIIEGKDNNGKFLDNWWFSYSKKQFILYDLNKLQDKIYSCEENNMLNVDNTMENFLNGIISYEVLDDSNDILIYSDIKLNLEDTTNEQIFNNFKIIINFKFNKFNNLINLINLVMKQLQVIFLSLLI